MINSKNKNLIKTKFLKDVFYIKECKNLDWFPNEKVYYMQL